MAKPVIVTRIGKGSELTFTEGDANFTNLQNATVSVAGDSGTTQALDLNDTLTVAGGTGLSSVMTTDTVTLNLDNTAVTPASYTLSSITVDAQGRITAASNGTAGDAVGPASSTDNAITRFDSTTGKLLQNSLVTVADDGAITAPAVGSVIPFYYANQAGFPSANTYHGALAHSHSDGKMYFAHGGSWNALANSSDVPSIAGLEVTSAKNQNNGYAGLDAGGKVASAQLPSYVDDVEEYAAFVNFPVTGETSKIYVALDINKIYRWSGSAYVEISASPGTTDNVPEGTTNKYFTNTLARGAFSASTGITITDGAVATTITQYTDAAARSAVSVTDASGDGSLSYSSGTGVITYTGPSAAEVRAHISAGTGISITNGVIASTVSAGLSDIVNDTTPQLGGSLDVNGQSIVSVSNGNITLSPNGTGKVVLSGVSYPTTGGTVGQVLTSNGSGVATFATPAGGGPTTATIFTSQYSDGYYVWDKGIISSGITGLSMQAGNAGWIVPAGSYIFRVHFGTYIASNNNQQVYEFRDMTTSTAIQQHGMQGNDYIRSMFWTNQLFTCNTPRTIRLTVSPGNNGYLLGVFLDIYKTA